jgi:hypothetical protein
VRVQQEWDFARTVESHGLRHNPVNFLPIGAALPVDNFRLAQRIFPQPGVLIGEWSDRGEGEIGGKYFAPAGWIGAGAGRRLPVGADLGEADYLRFAGQWPNRGSRHVDGEYLL